MTKLFEFQTRVGAIKKDSTNPYYKSKYADINSLLETVKPLLNEIGLTVIQPLEVRDGKNVLATKVMDGSEVLIESAIIIPDNPDPQKIGSAITYYRRYSLQALLLLEAEDDDANSAIPAKKVELKKPDTKTKSESGYDPNVLDKIKECKTVAELNDLWASLGEDIAPDYVDKFSTRKSIIQANKTKGK